MQQRFLLQILLLAQHVSGTIMPIIRSSRVLIKIYDAINLPVLKRNHVLYVMSFTVGQIADV